jgi:hypothetical protein
MTYNLTNKQKEAAKALVGIGRTWRGEFLIAFYGAGKSDIVGYDHTPPNVSQGDIQALEKEGLVICDRTSHDNVHVTLSAKAYEAVDADFKMADIQPTSPVTIGAVIGTMSGGNLQAVGSAQGSELKQIINDPDLLRQRFEADADKLLTEVKSALDDESYNRYLRAVEELKQQVLAKEQNPSLIKWLLQQIAFLGDVEGTIGLITRVWPLVQPLLVIVAMKLGQGT